MLIQQEKSGRRIGGFTILELLISMVITVILVTILINMTTVSSDTLTRAQTKVQLSRKASRILDIMETDLQSIVIRRDGNEWFYAGLPIDEFGIRTIESWVDANGDSIVGAIDEDKVLPSYLRTSKIIDESNSESENPLGVNQDNNKVNSRKSYSFPSVLNLVYYSAVVDRYDGQVGPGEDKDMGGDVSLVEYQLDYRNVINKLDDTVNDKENSDPSLTFFRWIEFPDNAYRSLFKGDANRTPNLLEILHSTKNADGRVSAENKQQLLSVLSSRVYGVSAVFNISYQDGGATKSGSIVLAPMLDVGGNFQPQSPSGSTIDGAATCIRITGGGELRANCEKYFSRDGAAGEYAANWVPKYPDMVIESVNISLLLLDNQGVSYINQVATGGNDYLASGSKDGRAELIKRHGYSFSRTIRFPDY